MRFGLVLAFLLSTVLISVASWWRFGNTEAVLPGIVAVKQVGMEDLYSNEEILKDFTAPKSASTTAVVTAPETLNNTDILARNLISNYVITATSMGGAVNANTINAIAEQHVNVTGGIHTFNSISIQEISVVEDNETNARNYAKEFSRIYSDYTWKLTLLSSNLNDLEALARAYENTSSALKALPVPTSVSMLHLQLVNNHASTAAAMRSMKEVETDPIKTLAGMEAINENVLKEESALADIDRILREKYDTL